MDIKDQYHTLSKIISKELMGSATDTEKEYLEDWLKASKDNQRVYEKMKRDGWYQDQQEIHKRFNAAKGWAQIQPKITQGPKVVWMRPTYFKYAAVAASILVFLSVFLFKADFQAYFTPGAEHPIITNNNIEPGSNKAILTLSDGQNLVLDQQDSIQVGNAKSSGKEIIYEDIGTDDNKMAYNTLTVPRGGQFSLVLSDGTKVWLNADSQVRYPVQFVEGQRRDMELVHGEVYLDVSPSTAHGGASFVVKHKEQQVEVLGTEFNIKAYGEEPKVYTTLVEGKVQVQTNRGEHILSPGQQSILSVGTGRLAVTEVDVFREVSWKEGTFRFKDKNLKDIMQVLSRWYDMEVVFGSKDLEKKTFTGTLHKDRSITEILGFLQGSINTYEINDRTIVLK